MAGVKLSGNTIVSVIMCCALLWWVSRNMSWTRRLGVTAATLMIVVGIILFERARNG